MNHTLITRSVTFSPTIGQTPSEALKKIITRQPSVFSTRNRITRAWSSEKTSSALPAQPTTSIQIHGQSRPRENADSRSCRE